MATPATPKSVTVKDALGRSLVLVPLQPHEMLDLFEAAGTNSGNGAWVRMALLVCSVRSIDDVPLPYPTMKDQVRGNAKLLGNEGLVAAQLELMGADDESALDTTAEDTAAAKN